jgi:hypothetical protein
MSAKELPSIQRKGRRERVLEPSSRTGVAPVSDFEPENGNPWFRVSLCALRSLWLNLFSINRKEHSAAKPQPK